jgi:hypothetical protein
MPAGYAIDPNTGQYVQAGQPTYVSPPQQPVATPAPVAAAAPEPSAAKPAEAPKPVGPPRNTLVARLKPAPENIRRTVRSLIKNAYGTFVEEELESALRPVLFSDADRDRLLGLAERKDSLMPDMLENLNTALGLLDVQAVRLKLDNLKVGRDEYSGVIERIAAQRLYRDLCDAGLQSASKTKQMVSKLTAAAAKAGLPRDLVKSVAQRIEAFSQVYEALEDSEVSEDGFDLATATPETVFTVVRWRGFVSNFPMVLAPETLLLPLVTKGPGAGKLIIETATATELGLPICGSLDSPVPDASPEQPAAPVGVVLRVDPRVRFTATVLVSDATEKLSSPYTIKPGESLPFPDRKSVQIAFSDNKGGWGGWETIAAGSHVYTVQAGAWHREAEPTLIAIDNTANGYPFHYRIAGVAGTVPARQAVTMNCHTPETAIEFHRGGPGDAVATKLLSGRDERVVVRVAANLGLDLFEPERTLVRDSRVLADARPASPIITSEIPSGATSRSATPRDGTLANIPPRFPVGSLDE